MDIRELMRYAETRMRKVNGLKLDDGAGAVPEFPMLIVYVGDKSIERYRWVSDRLFHIWPAYINEIKQYALKGNGELSELSADEEAEDYKQSGHGIEGEKRAVAGKALDDRALGDSIAGLFSENMHFHNNNLTLVYYVCDTEDMQEEADFNQYMKLIEALGTKLEGITSISESMYILLNEINNYAPLPKYIKNHMAHKAYPDKFDTEERADNKYSIYLLSNRCDDNTIKNRESLYKIIPPTILLSNNPDAYIRTHFLSKDIKTIAYMTQEKPYDDVANIIVRLLISELTGLAQQRNSELSMLSEDTIAQKIGLSNTKSFEILDKYAEEHIFGLLPGPEELNHFPRYTDEDIDASQLDFEGLNQLTMGSWECFLSQKIEDIERRIEESKSIKDSFVQVYEAFLSKNCSASELIYLSDNPNRIKELIDKIQSPNRSGVFALDASKAYIKYLLSSNSTLRQLFIGSIHRLAEGAQAFNNIWRSILKSNNAVHNVEDRDMQDFYTSKFTNYMDTEGRDKIYAEFLKLSDEPSLRNFLEETLHKLINADPVYRASLEAELEARFAYKKQDLDIGGYIIDRLTDANLLTYIKLPFALGVPTLSSMLLKTDSNLHTSIKNNMPNDTYYYNTGLGTRIDIIKVYRIDYTNLIG